MNIVFEGINGSGKSTLIKEVCKSSKNLIIHDDINTETICSPILQSLFKENPMMHDKQEYDTAIGESLILLTDFNCMMTKNDSQQINIYDRFYFTTLVYQTYILNKYSRVSKRFLKLYEELLKINAVKIDYLIYVDVDIKTNIKRTEFRDKRKLDNESIEFFTQMQKDLKKYCINYCKKNHIRFLILNGTECISDNVYKIKNFIKELNL